MFRVTTGDAALQRCRSDQHVALRPWVRHMEASGAASDGDIDRQQPTLERRQQVPVQPAAESFALPFVSPLGLRHTVPDVHDGDPAQHRPSRPPRRLQEVDI